MLTVRTRWLIALAALLLAAPFVWPLWEVTLTAPQYPEGLGMHIWIRTVTGIGPDDLGNINMLNHYIGMKRIEPDTIAELRFMPVALGALVAGALAVAASGRRWLARTWLAVFVLGAVAGLADFWWWEYDYGHHLDLEHAAIKIPGMSYQPPLLGAKQLLNFTATSWPALGGLLAIAALVLAAVVILTDGRRRRGAAIAAVAGAAACSPAPRTLVVGQDACAWCRMTVADPRFAAEAVTKTGKTYVFDSIDCLANWVRQQPDGTVATAVVADYREPTHWVDVGHAQFVVPARVTPPMGRPILAVGADADPAALARDYGGRVVRWQDILATLAQQAPAPAGAAS